MIAPLLVHVDPSKPFVLKTDASDYALNVVFSQPKKVNFLHPIGFHSCKFSPTNINYEIYDKEHLAIVDAFK